MIRSFSAYIEIIISKIHYIKMRDIFSYFFINH